ncbi:MAG TPA: TonB-dependent receptor, partial [Microscillaceae bacterium]|nr:TonB-dependent receptor [Microscillaceae bacterium]
DNVEAIMQVAGGYGNSVYTGAARVRLGNFFYWQGKAELKGSNFFLRAYTTQERSGESYDIGFVGLGLNRAGKSDQQWFEDYALAFRGAAIGLGVAAFDHNFAREFADGNLSNNFSANQLNFFGITSGVRNNLGRLTPGSPDFNRVKNDLVNTPISQGGALFFDESNLYHTEGMYNFNKIINPNTVELIVGGHYRMIQLNSRGTVFDDAERRLNISEVGGYIQATKKVFNDKLKLTASARYDKNQNFEGRFTPRVAAVYSLGNARQHNIRISYQTAFRNPTVQDQYLNLTVGGFVRVVGGLPEFIERNNLNNNVVRADAQSIGNYLQLLNTQGAVAARTNGTYRFNQFRPEFVNSYELGYKGLINNKLFIDTYVYYNQYSNFIGTLNFIAPNAGQDITTVQFNPADASPVIGTFQLFQVPVNLANLNSYGWGLGVDYNLPGGFTIGGNISHNKLLDAPSNFRTQFNTPEYRTNVSFGNRNIKGTSLGFNVVWRWQETFTWQSTFGDGVIPAYHTLDAQISYRLKDLKSIAKIGGTNLLNQFYTQSFGNPQIGALYYVSITFDQVFNK